MLFNKKYGNFGLIVYPAEFFMHVVSPLLVFLFFAMVLWSAVSNVYVGYIVLILIFVFAVFSIVKRGLFALAVTFLQSQGILLISLFYLLLGRSQTIWPQVEEIRQLWQSEDNGE